MKLLIAIIVSILLCVSCGTTLGGSRGPDPNVYRNNELFCLKKDSFTKQWVVLGIREVCPVGTRYYPTIIE